MPKISKTQETALEVVDFIYFYDLATLASFTEEKKEVYGQINNVIDTIVLIKKFFAEKAEIYRHFLLCGVEVVATRSIDFTSLETDGKITEFIPPLVSKEVNKKRYGIAFKAVYDAVCESGYDGSSFIEDVFCVVESTGIRERSHGVCFRLVFQVLWSDTEIGLAHHAYKKMLDLSILKTDKYTPNNSYAQIEDEYLFLRIILFIEFEIMRNKLHHLHDKPVFREKIGGEEISEKRKEKREALFLKMSQFDINFKKTEARKIRDYNWDDKKSIDKYLDAVRTDLCHNRLFSDSQNWGSLLGVGYLLYFKEIEPNRAVFRELNNKETCSDKASVMLREQFGLCISARNINNIFSKKINPFYHFIKVAVKELTEVEKYGFIGPSLTQFFYYRPEMSEKLNSILENMDRKA